jgi:hypothetical protein
MPVTSLEDLNRQIAQREQELESLRQELESRRNQFATLKRRKQELLSQLRQVDSEIAALTATQPAPTAQAKMAAPTTPPLKTQAKGRPRLGETILTVLRECGKAMTARQLSEEVRQRGFPLSSKNPVKPVESRLQEMKKKRLVQRASGQPGYIPVPPSHGGKAEKTTSPAPKAKEKTAAKPGKLHPAAKTAQAGHRGQQPSLKEALANVLKNNSRKHLSGSELAELVLASGYKTKSTKFRHAVWSILGQMDNVEHIRGKGYRLKKT